MGTTTFAFARPLRWELFLSWKKVCSFSYVVVVVAVEAEDESVSSQLEPHSFPFRVAITDTPVPRPLFVFPIRQYDTTIHAPDLVVPVVYQQSASSLQAHGPG